MKYLRSLRYLLGPVVAIFVAIWFFRPLSTSGETLIGELKQSVSGEVQVVEVCAAAFNRISQPCVVLDSVSRSDFLKAVGGAKIAFPLDHPKLKNEYVLRVKTADTEGQRERIACFQVNENVGMSDLIFSSIDAGEQCSEKTFQWRGGTVKVANFLNGLESVGSETSPAVN